MTGFQSVPLLWNDATVHILGGGPGLLRTDLARLRGNGTRVIATNHAYRTGPWDVVVFGDLGFYRSQHEGLLGFAGLKVGTHRSLIGRPGLHVVKKKNHPFGIRRDRNVLAWNLSTGGMAINLAVHLGARKIVLHGYDMRRVPIGENDVDVDVAASVDGARCNWHERSGAPKSKDPYARFLRPFVDIARDLKALNVEGVNATPGSALTEFPIVEPEEVYSC